MTDLATKLAILEAIQSDVRHRVDRIVDRLAQEVESNDDGSAPMAAALRCALADLSEVLAEGIHAQIREGERADREDRSS